MTRDENGRAPAAAYYPRAEAIRVPSAGKTVLSRLAFPLLCLLSRQQSLALGLVPIDDERVIMALRNVRGYLLDVGCGSNLLVRSHGRGVGVDVFPWHGCDRVIEDAARLPFPDGTFDTVSYLACLNHITNREASVRDAFRVLKPGGRLIVTMVTPLLGAFIHWLRSRNDPDGAGRGIDRDRELPGMSPRHVLRILRDTGFVDARRERFVYGLNSLYLADKL